MSAYFTFMPMTSEYVWHQKSTFWAFRRISNSQIRLSIEIQYVFWWTAGKAQSHARNSQEMQIWFMEIFFVNCYNFQVPEEAASQGSHMKKECAKCKMQHESTAALQTDGSGREAQFCKPWLCSLGPVATHLWPSVSPFNKSAEKV